MSGKQRTLLQLIRAKEPQIIAGVSQLAGHLKKLPLLPELLQSIAYEMSVWMIENLLSSKFKGANLSEGWQATCNSFLLPEAPWE